MLSGPLLVTERLILRPPVAQDFDAFAAMQTEPETMTYLGGPIARPVAWRQFLANAGEWQISGFSFFSVIERATGEWVGRIGPSAPEGWPAPEIAYVVRQKFARRGYAYEASVAAIDFVVEFLGWDQIAHTINPENQASIALARKLGAENQGPTRLPAPFEASRVDLWSQSAEQWKTNAAARKANT